jgi:hypothetical protein
VLVPGAGVGRLPLDVAKLGEGLEVGVDVKVIITPPCIFCIEKD